ncbi:alginate export family protein [Nitrospina sp. 32_T5]|uniref:alginate export family protein n=1 Tax=unclassified Nitrospina TaxID=2638683 RepID=UPI003F948785
MKRKLLAAGAVAVAVLLAGVMVAQAASVKFGGQMRPRYEIFEQNDFDKKTDPTHFFLTRIRLNADVNIDDKIGAFIQFQARGVYGAGTGGLIPGPAPGPRNAAVPADGLVDVGLHQAYFTVQDFFGMPADLKIGRQEVVLDGHRLFGNTGWTTGAQSADAIRLDHHHGDNMFSYIFIKAIEANGSVPFAVGGNSAGAPINLGGAGPGGLLGQGTCGRGTGFGGGDLSDNCDREDHVFWGNIKTLVPNAVISPYLVITVDNSWNGSGTSAGNPDNEMITVGGRIAGNMAGFDYRFEGYFQGGRAEGIATTMPATGKVVSAANLAAYTKGGGSGVDRRAYMIGARLGKSFKNVMWTPSVTLWYDRLSGTDSEDVQDGIWGTFDTLYDTGHKFYGYMDTYLNATGGDTSYLGLEDIAIKTSMNPAANWTVKADFHYFKTPAENIDLGRELDITFVHKYSSNLTMTAGYSNYWADPGFILVNPRVSRSAGQGGIVDGSANWGYVQLDLKF